LLNIQITIPGSAISVLQHINIVPLFSKHLKRLLKTTLYFLEHPNWSWYLNQ